MSKNKVYLVGAGPGRPDLITARGLNILKAADVVIYDYLVDEGLLAHAREGAELICCDRLGKKRYSDVRLRQRRNFTGDGLRRTIRRSQTRKYLTEADGFSKHQEKINELIVEKVKEGKKVMRLKNGDPSIFSRCSQELDMLIKEGIEFELVPGVTTASAASCSSGIPLTDRRFASSCILVTGHEDPLKKQSLIDWDSLAKSGTVILYMAVDNLDRIVKKLIQVRKNKNTPCAIVQEATLLTQEILTGTLRDIVIKAKRQGIRPPAIIIIGEVVRLEKDFNWFRKNNRVLFTGLSAERFFMNGTYFHLPLIKIGPLKDYKEFDAYLKKIRQFDWIVFVSRYGVEYFFKRLKKIGYDSRVLSGIKIAAIGDSTRARLLDFGISADLVPQDESSKGLVGEFKKIDIRGKKIFLPRSDISDKGLGKCFEKLSANVTTSFAYRNVMPEGLPDIDLNKFDEIMFTSPSTVRNFKKRYGRLAKNIRVRCIGDVTLKEAKRCHLLD